MICIKPIPNKPADASRSVFGNGVGTAVFGVVVKRMPESLLGEAWMYGTVISDAKSAGVYEKPFALRKLPETSKVY